MSITAKSKILFILPSLRGGGAERIVLTLLTHLDRDKFQLCLALLEKTGDYLGKVPSYIKIFNLNKSKARYAIFSLAKLIDMEKPNIIFSIMPQTIALTKISLLFTKYKPKWVIRSDNYRPKGSLPFLTGLLIKKAYQQAERIVCESEASRIICIATAFSEEFIKKGEVNQKKIRIILNPFNLEGIRELSKERVKENYFSKRPVIMGCGRLEKVKGFPFLIKGFSLILSKYPEAKLLILGRGEEEKNLKRLVEKLNIKDKVEFLGFQKNPYKYMREADLFVLSSLWESFGMVLIEAMTCGTPIIATDCPFGPGEVLGDSKYGLLVPPADEKTLAAALVRMLDNPQMARSFSEKAEERVKDFSKEKIIQEYENLFSELIQNEAR